jgi:hypothetical protein
VVELTNGCLCCSISSELKTAVWNLLQQADIGKIDWRTRSTCTCTERTCCGGRRNVSSLSH